MRVFVQVTSTLFFISKEIIFMTLVSMRNKVAKVYDNETWRRRVNHMRPQQVYAIYCDFKERGKFDKDPNEVQYKQMTIFDYI